jgi:hypothetical protein
LLQIFLVFFIRVKNTKDPVYIEYSALVN